MNKKEDRKRDMPNCNVVKGGSKKAHRLGIHLILRLLALLLLHLEEQRAVDPGQDTAERDGGADQGIQLFVAADGQLQVAGGDTLDLEVLGGVTGEFEDFGSQVFEDGGDIDGSCRRALLIPYAIEGRGNGRRNFQRRTRTYPWHRRASYFGCWSSGSASHGRRGTAEKEC